MLSLLVIPYFLCFAWIDDKRDLFIKDETMYPELTPMPDDIKIRTKVISPTEIEEEEAKEGESPGGQFEFDKNSSQHKGSKNSSVF